MSYQVLARKYRPQTFQDMMGQQHVLRALCNALDQERLHHAYLFTGTRGVGKTTIGRILAKCLNCENGITATPCGQCTSCQAISKGNYIDLIEVDAASRTKVEDTRELLDNVQYAPSVGRFKIYLIDEVHMLSNHSFNALLKTLEEPPAHVKFLLATTDPDKLPVTILSRCLQFNLQNMLPEQIQQQCQNILNTEAITFEPEALNQIAYAAKGSMRDALSLLDQAIAYCAGPIQANPVQQMLGHISQSKMIQIITALANHDSQQLMDLSQELALQGVNFATVTDHLINTLHDMALLKQCPDLELTSNPPAELTHLAQAMRAEDIQLHYQIALLGRRDLALSPDPQRGFQMLLLRLLCFTPKQNQATTPASVPQPQAAAPQPKRQPQSPAQPPVQPSISAAIPSSNEDWIKLISDSNLSGMCLTLASHCTLQKSENNHLYLHLDPSQAPLLIPRSKQRLQESIAQTLNTPINISIECVESKYKTPAIHTRDKQDAKQQSATTAVEQDPNVQAIMEQFNAKLSKETVKPTE